MAVIQPLDSLDNKSVRTVRRLLDNRVFREKQQQAVLEGFHMVSDAVDAGVVIHLVFYGQRLVSHTAGRSLLARLQASHTRLMYVTDHVLDDLSAVETHQGILAVVNVPQWVSSSMPLPETGPFLIAVAHGIQDPGNLGTLIRSYQAAGAHMVGVTKGTVDVYNPKTLRASAGSVFKLPVVGLSEQWMEELAQCGVAVVTTVVTGGVPYDLFDWSSSVAIVLGNEGSGLPPEVSSRATQVSIPMAPAAESLNVAAAGSILAFHAASDRRRHRIPMTPPVMIK